MVNVGVCTTPFYRPTALDLAYDEFVDRSKGATLQQFVQNRLHQAPHIRITSSSAEKIMLIKDGRQISVAEHFQNAHKILLERPDLPVADLGTERRSIYVPLELCMIESQPFRGLLEDRETTNMLNNACRPPATNWTPHLRHNPFRADVLQQY
ncbi:PAZ domain-containing protein [Suillus placidus]|uniref:PAZ domain-containing protein n=1 Tax=Suillus placidus TaxID=48579 RepID=A0A9P6ZKA0_9AGAM|nr:PAZ domain-containing protein [Suillus placidus]